MSQRIINYAFNTAITNRILLIIKECLESGAVITIQSIMNFSAIINRHVTETDIVTNISVLKLLLESDPVKIMRDSKLVTQFVTNHNSTYLKTIIDFGYNGKDFGSDSILWESIQRWTNLCDQSATPTSLLLNNGFDHLAQDVLIRCIENDYFQSLKLIVSFGANLYSVLDQICLLVNSQFVSRPTLEFIIDSMYKIEFLSEPIMKYLILTEIQHVIPKDIVIYIIRSYMEIDYDRTNKLRLLLPVHRDHVPLSCYFASNPESYEPSGSINMTNLYAMYDDIGI